MVYFSMTVQRFSLKKKMNFIIYKKFKETTFTKSILSRITQLNSRKKSPYLFISKDIFPMKIKIATNLLEWIQILCLIAQKISAINLTVVQRLII